MKNIKMRVWDKGKQKFASVASILIRPDEDCYKFSDVSMARFDFEFFTGMKDKNQKDIYEGDYVRGFDSTFLIEYGIARRKFYPEQGLSYELDIPSFYFLDILSGKKAFPVVYNFKGEHDLKTLEVFGNKHETELPVYGTS